MSAQKIDYNKIFNNLLLNWVVTSAAITVIIFLSLWVSHRWLPLVIFAFIPLLIAWRNSENGAPCSIISRHTEYALGVSALIMIFINFAGTRMGQNLLGLPPRNDVIPYVPVAILYPILLVFRIAQLLRTSKTKLTPNSSLHSLSTADNTVARGIFVTQIRFLSRLSICILLVASAAMLAYFFTEYININYSGSDIFFFFALPVIIFFLAVIYVFLHFSNLKFSVVESNGADVAENNVIARFLVVKGDTMLLTSNATEIPDMTFMDTPAVCQIHNLAEVTDEHATGVFKAISGITSDFTVRSLYHLTDSDSGDDLGVFAVFIDDEATVPGLGGEWCDIQAIDEFYNSGRLTGYMSYDLLRIYTITMAWKTYTGSGRRRYPIKNYRPTFNISDLKNQDVDYSDLHWVDVYEINEDRPFWRIRRLWRRCLNGFSTKFGS